MQGYKFVYKCLLGIANLSACNRNCTTMCSEQKCQM